ncbi:MAG: hypothetical protein CVT92_02090 [Bacteroidetes bacterium HGW-Bacteroidetes-1]|jgi:hypothetical protein|nr:MAG: hypothetical protein CVT92_02090 [Bacteroidetes bacterium HGW-Bacteroidetes-1]
MTCIGTVLSTQARKCGQTTRMICDAIKMALENPEKHILLCISHNESLPELPQNIAILKAHHLNKIISYVSGKSEEAVFIDHHIKDNTLIDQAKYINILKERISQQNTKIEKIKQLIDV